MLTNRHTESGHQIKLEAGGVAVVAARNVVQEVVVIRSSRFADEPVEVCELRLRGLSLP